MSRDYSAVLLETPTGCCLELVPEFGGLANRLRLAAGGRQQEVIVGLPDRHAMLTDKVFRGIPLFPFANRLDAGRYTHLGREYQLAINEPARNNALHGFLHHLPPIAEVTRTDQTAEAVLRYAYKGDVAGYPFPADVNIHFLLHNSGRLDITFSVHNRHSSAIPVGLGWHPYFGFGNTIDDLHLQLPVVQHAEVNERFLPTGAKKEFSQFHRPTLIADTRLDHCFVIRRAPDQAMASSLLWSEQRQIGLEIWQQTGANAFNFIQVCTAGDRRSIAIEPVSCGLDAFNTGEGLILLESGQVLTAHMGIRLLTQLDAPLAE